MRFSDEWVFGLVGAGGFAREVMPLVLAAFGDPTGAKLASHICFVETTPAAPVVNGVPCISEEEFFALPTERRSFNVAVADSRMRQAIAERWIAQGIEPHTVRAPTVRLLSDNRIGPGAIFCDHSMVTSNARIGAFFHANIYSYVAHDCIIGDYVTFAPRVHCNGNVHIGDHAYVGTGAMIKQGTSDEPLAIGPGAVIGMGAVVTRSVPPHTTVVGNPARPLERPSTN